MGDLISRKAILNYVCDACNKQFSDKPCEPAECLILQAISVATAVEAEPVRHGRWIAEDGPDEDGNGQYRCSQCGAGEKHIQGLTVPYCWKCGANMDLEV